MTEKLLHKKTIGEITPKLDFKNKKEASSLMATYLEYQKYWIIAKIEKLQELDKIVSDGKSDLTEINIKDYFPYAFNEKAHLCAWNADRVEIKKRILEIVDYLKWSFEITEEDLKETK